MRKTFLSFNNSPYGMWIESITIRIVIKQNQMQLVLLLVPLHLLGESAKRLTKQDDHLITAKQALSAGEYAKAYRGKLQRPLR